MLVLKEVIIMYITRILEHTIKENLITFEAITLVGPKFCGKMTLSE